MDICLITPAAHTNFTDLLPGRFCLANEAIREPHYKNYFTSEARNGRRVILDNGVFEADLVTDEKLVKLTNEINPPVLIVPDKINANWNANVLRADQFAACYEPELVSQELMFVVQTEVNDEEGFWGSLDWWITDRRFRWLGICRDACRNAFEQYTFTADQELNRFYFLSEFVRRGYLKKIQKRQKKLHLLGVGDNWWILQYAWFVESADTASLFWQATVHGNMLDASGRFWQLSNGRPYNYMQKTYEEQFAIVRGSARRTIEHNCQAAQSWANKANTLRKQNTLNERI